MYSHIFYKHQHGQQQFSFSSAFWSNSWDFYCASSL